MKRSRRNNRRPSSGGSPQGQSYNPNRTFDSAGPDIKIRGSAAQVYEKYLQLARDANTSGDRVMAESYLQHAEHYYRILAAAQAQQQQQYQMQQAANPNGNGGQPMNANGNGRPVNGNGEQPYIEEQQQGDESFGVGEHAESQQPGEILNEGF